MCHGRSYNCIAQLQDYFPYHMVVGIIQNAKLPNLVRKVFCKLMIALWVDRYPHAANCGRPQLPDLAWIKYSLHKQSTGDEGALPMFDLGVGHPLLLKKEDEFMSMR